MNQDTKAVDICFIAPKAYPLFNPDVKEIFGGAEVQLYFLATELAKDEDFAVSFITADYGQDKIETLEGVTIIKSVDFKENLLTGALKVWRAMRTANAQIYCRSAPSGAVFLIALFCRLHKRVFIYRTASKGESDGTYRVTHLLAGKAFYWSLRKANQVVVQNQADKEALEKTAGVGSVVIRNAQHLSVLPEGKRDVILWVGRSTHFKKPELFVDLAEEVPDEKFTMICQRATGDTKYDRLLARAKAVENLEFIEQVPFDKIGSYFQRSKAFVNTSWAEGFPNTFIQACSCATPILSLTVNPDGFLDRYNCGICCNGQWDKFVDSLRFMLAENRYVELGKNGREYVEKNHDIKKIVEEYKNLFRNLI